MKGFFRRAVYWVPAVVWMGLIFYFSSLTEPVPGVSGKPYEELVSGLSHLMEYAGLTVWFIFGWKEGRLFDPDLSLRVLIYSAVLAVLFGLTDEVHQIFVPGRSFQVKDLAIDALGAGLAGAIIWGMRSRAALAGWKVEGVDALVR